MYTLRSGGGVRIGGYRDVRIGGVQVHVAPLSHYMFNFTTVVFDGTPPPPFISQTLRDGTPQVQMLPYQL